MVLHSSLLSSLLQVSDLEMQIESAEGIARKGLILATLTKLKQICNHPDQFLGLNSYKAAESGKFETLREICETIYEKRERVLIFTQYREITDYLSEFLKDIFHREGGCHQGSGEPIGACDRDLRDRQHGFAQLFHDGRCAARGGRLL